MFGVDRALAHCLVLDAGHPYSSFSLEQHIIYIVNFTV
jgi:hypothetical protein